MNPTREAAGKETPHAAFGGWTLLLALVLAWFVVLLSG